MVKILIILVLLIVTIERTVIGVLTQPCTKDDPCNNTFNVSDESEYIPATYIQYLESASATAIPISYRISNESLIKLMKIINGVLITGGGQLFFECDDYNYPINYTQFAWTAHNIMSIAIQMNNDGIYFPIWGTCMGFQLLAIDGSKSFNTYKKCNNSQNYMASLQLTNDAQFSNFIKYLSPVSQLKLETVQYTFNNHIYCIFDNDLTPEFNDMYYVVSSSNPLIGEKAFISFIEGKKYPFYGAQFHPETWQYTISKSRNVTHNIDTIELGQEMSNFFVNEARKNKNTIDFNLLTNISVYSYTYSLNEAMTYVFDLTNYSKYPFKLDPIIPPVHQTCG